MNVQPIPQLVVHETNNVECVFVFNKAQNLDNNNINKFHIFKELMGKDGIYRKFSPKPMNCVQLIVFTQYWFSIMNHGHIEEFFFGNQDFELTTK
jgi:hypothetical protein